MKDYSIVWDVDDTLANFIERTIGIVKTRIGHTIELDEIKTGMWLHDLLDEQQLASVLPHVFTPAFYESLSPTAVAFKTHTPEWKALHEVYHFQAVTARQLALGYRALDITSKWLNRFGVCMDGVTICHPNDSKLAFAPSNTTVFVEDSAKVAEEALRNGYMVFLLDRPWNRELQGYEQLIRCDYENLVETMHKELLCKSS